MSETVEVLIKIPKQIYEKLDNPFDEMWDHYLVPCGYAIRNGTVLPKGHGRLIDVDAATKSIDTFHDSFVKECDMLSGKFSIVCTAPTVIEADREVENG